MLKFGGGETSPPLEAIEYILLETENGLCGIDPWRGQCFGSML
jgi:hypothetical protein